MEEDPHIQGAPNGMHLPAEDDPFVPHAGANADPLDLGAVPPGWGPIQLLNWHDLFRQYQSTLLPLELVSKQRKLADKAAEAGRRVGGYPRVQFSSLSWVAF